MARGDGPCWPSPPRHAGHAGLAASAAVIQRRREAPEPAARHALEQYLTESQFLAQDLRQLISRWQCSQILLGKKDLLPLNGWLIGDQACQASAGSPTNWDN